MRAENTGEYRKFWLIPEGEIDGVVLRRIVEDARDREEADEEPGVWQDITGPDESGEFSVSMPHRKHWEPTKDRLIDHKPTPTRFRVMLETSQAKPDGSIFLRAKFVEEDARWGADWVSPSSLLWRIGQDRDRSREAAEGPIA